MRLLAILTLFCLLSACSRTEGKTLFDYLQYLLNQDTGLRWIACIFIAYVLLQALRLLRFAAKYAWLFLRSSYRQIFGWGRRNLIGIALAGTVLWLLSTPLIDLLQEFEQRYLAPVYVDEFTNLSEAHLTAIYEEELGKHVDAYDKSVIIHRTREMAEKIESTPLAIYEAAYLECGLKPFEVRSDLVAAGWIQFTRAGVASLQYRGKAVRFDDVLTACREKDIEYIMDLSEVYLVHQYEKSGRKPLLHTIDLYLALFAPALIGKPQDQVVYAGLDNPSYYKNSGLDGWYVSETADGRKQVFHKRSACDGKITIWEIYLALLSKKHKAVGPYLQ